MGQTIMHYLTATLSERSVEKIKSNGGPNFTAFGSACLAAFKKSAETGERVTVLSIIEPCETNDTCLDAVQISVTMDGGVRCTRWHMG